MKTFSHLYGDAYHPINKKRSSFESWNWVLHFGGGVNLTSRNKGLPVARGFLLLFEPNRDFNPSCGKNWSVGGHIIIDQLFWDIVHVILILLFLMWYTAVLFKAKHFFLIQIGMSEEDSGGVERAYLLLIPPSPLLGRKMFNTKTSQISPRLYFIHLVRNV